MATSRRVPQWVLDRLDERLEAGWTGKAGLGARQGKILEIEWFEREREPESA